PIIAALVTGFGLSDIGGFFTEGIDKVIDVVIMFIFAILYFGIMQQVGLFDPLINKMVQITQGNVITISIGTVIIATVGHLDGSGAFTFLITIPALFPLSNQMKKNPYLLLLFIGCSVCSSNIYHSFVYLVRSPSVN